MQVRYIFLICYTLEEKKKALGNFISVSEHHGPVDVPLDRHEQKQICYAYAHEMMQTQYCDKSYCQEPEPLAIYNSTNYNTPITLLTVFF